MVCWTAGTQLMYGFEVSTVCGGVQPLSSVQTAKGDRRTHRESHRFLRADVATTAAFLHSWRAVPIARPRRSPDRPRSASRRPKMQLRYRKMALLCSKTPPCCSKAHRTRISQGRPHDSTEQSKSNIQSTRLVNGASGLATKCVGAADDLLHPGAKSRQAGQNVAQKTVSTAR